MPDVKSNFVPEKSDKKSKKSNEENERLDLPIGDDIDNVVSRRKYDEKETKSYATQSSSSKTPSKKRKT